MSNEKLKSKSYNFTEMHLHSVLNSALTINQIHGNKLDFDTLLADLIEQTTELVIKGSIRGVETMLATQANTLNMLFHRMTTMAMQVDNLEQMQGLTDIGLKAQKQCRQTLIALLEIKNPRGATFVKQQNVAVNQQVNNASQEQNFEKSANELLKEASHEALDGGRAQQAITANPRMEAMVQCKRTDNS